MRSDSVKNVSAYADQNHAPSLAAARLDLIVFYHVKILLATLESRLGTIWGRSLVAFLHVKKATKLRPQMVFPIASNYGELQFFSIFQVMVKMLECLQIQKEKRRT